MNSAHLNLRPVVLLVEDEPLLRFFASDVLDDADFAVIETGNADEALTWLEGRDDVRVIFTDIQMPGRPERTRSRRSRSSPLARDPDPRRLGRSPTEQS
jgi:CheY-like chemotaxis protein